MQPYREGADSFLVARGFDVKAEEVRFVNIFRRVWRKLPAVARRLVVEFWANDPGRQKTWVYVDGKILSPEIRIVDPRSFCRPLLSSCQRGHSVWYNIVPVTLMADESVESIIAHGLAFVVLFANGHVVQQERDISFSVKPGPTKSVKRSVKKLYGAAWDNSEAEAARIAAEWGFHGVPLQSRPDLPVAHAKNGDQTKNV